jgi:hypothetical protein
MCFINLHKTQPHKPLIKNHSPTPLAKEHRKTPIPFAYNTPKTHNKNRQKGIPLQRLLPSTLRLKNYPTISSSEKK